MKQFFKNSYPLIILLGLVVFLFVTNYTPGTLLSGWDNLHPEFDFGLNIKRSLFAVWQEYQGLGLLGGMAHSTDLLRQILLLLLSLFLPIESLRYIWVFMTLFIGATGTYYLILYIFNKHTPRHPEQREGSLPTGRQSHWDSSASPQNDKKNSVSLVIPLLGACFYLFNLATVQMFFVPFESFIGFFAFIPWLLLSCLLFLEHKKKKYTILLIVTLLLSTPAWYLQTLFIVFLMVLSIMLIPSILNRRSLPVNQNNKSYIHNLLSTLKRPLKLYTIIFLVNSFWLLPAIYFTATNSQVNLNSKINQMVTETIFLQNKEFGTLPDFMLLKGFMFKGVDPNSQGTITYMLKPWSDHLNNPLVLLSGYLLFAVVFIGFIKAIRSRTPALKGFSFLFIFSLVALAIDTFPFSLINSLFRENIPILNQIFRFPFTKFSTFTGLVFAVHFALGAQTIINNLKSRVKSHKIGFSNDKSPAFFIASLFLLLTLFIFPVFSGNLFYEKERIVMPQEYKDLFAFFKDQDKNSRIANFPQSNFWGWSFYEWQQPRSPAEALAKEDNQVGYGGSGFLWYGIKQPILDRAFDVWSQTGENYYFEVANALYSKNSQQLEDVFNKYQISWVLIDKNIFDPSSQKALFVPELEELLADIPGAKKTASFGKIDVYKISLKDDPKSFVFLDSQLPAVNTYSWNNIDQAYSDHGNYKAVSSQQSAVSSRLYPFRSLFSLKTQKEKEFDITEERATIALSTTLPKNTKGTLVIPSFMRSERIVPVHLRTRRTDSGAPRLEARVLLPQIIIGEREVQKSTGPVYQVQLPSPASPDRFPLTLSINGATFSPVTNTDKDIGVAFFILNSTNVLTVSDNAKQAVSEVVFAADTFSNYQNTDQTIELDNKTEQSFTVRFPKVDANFISFKPRLGDADKVQNCDNFRKGIFSSKTTDNSTLSLSATNAIACTAFFAQNLPHDQSYAIFIKSKHGEGQALRFWVENTDQQYAPLDVYLPKDKKQTTSSFILPPMEPFGSSYAFHFYNTSIGRGKTVNELNSLSVYPVFYNYLKSMRIQSENPEPDTTLATNLDVAHPNESLYIVQMADGNWQVENDTTLVLSQSYNNGWHAYAIQSSKFKVQSWLNQAFPFIFGKEIKTHVMVNNWENGWVLDNSAIQQSNNSTIVIVYLPQYLEYIGFCLLFITFAFIIFSANIRFRKKKNYE